MRCVLLSATLDLRRYYRGMLASIADRIEAIDHPATRAAEVRLALAWRPPDEAFACYPNLQAVCTIGAGADNVLACPSLPPGVDVVRVVDPAQAEMMSGFVAWHVISHQRRFTTYLAQQRDGLWRRLGQRRPQDVPVGILGHGAIGRRVAVDLMQLGFPVSAWRSRTEEGADIRAFHGRDGLAAMLADTEVLVNLLPLTAETRGILNRDLFARLRPGGYLVQVGRGEHLVEADLLAALDSGALAGAALDVFATEPLPPQHPFWRHPKVMVTPHDASDVSAQAIAATLIATAEALEAGRRPPHAVDRARGY
jgi:glyoxylate/hydroxypyruvate reductase A